MQSMYKAYRLVRGPPAYGSLERDDNADISMRLRNEKYKNIYLRCAWQGRKGS